MAKTVLPVADMNQAVDHYRRLGFEVEAFDDGHAWVRHDGEEVLHPAAHPDMAVRGPSNNLLRIGQNI